MYKVIKNIRWCGKYLVEGDLYDFPEATREAQLDALVAKGLIEKVASEEPVPVAEPPEQPAPVKAKPKSSKKKGR